MPCLMHPVAVAMLRLLMMKKQYGIHPDFKLLSVIRPPLKREKMPRMQKMMGLLFDRQHSDRRVMVEKLMAIDRGLPVPCAQLLTYPAVGNCGETESLRLYTDTPMCNTEDMNTYGESYRFYPTEGWQEIEVTFRNFDADNSTYLAFTTNDAVLIDDIKVTANYSEFIAQPHVLGVTDYQKDQFFNHSPHRAYCQHGRSVLLIRDECISDQIF